MPSGECVGSGSTTTSISRVPHRLIRQQLDARITAHTIELFCKGERVAVHLRGAARGRHTTIAEHMLSSVLRFSAIVGIENSLVGIPASHSAGARPG